MLSQSQNTPSSQVFKLIPRTLYTNVRIIIKDNRIYQLAYRVTSKRRLEINLNKTCHLFLSVVHHATLGGC